MLITSVKIIFLLFIFVPSCLGDYTQTLPVIIILVIKLRLTLKGNANSLFWSDVSTIINTQVAGIMQR